MPPANNNTVAIINLSMVPFFSSFPFSVKFFLSKSTPFISLPFKGCCLSPAMNTYKYQSSDCSLRHLKNQYQFHRLTNLSHYSNIIIFQPFSRRLRPINIDNGSKTSITTLCFHSLSLLSYFTCSRLIHLVLRREYRGKRA